MKVLFVASGRFGHMDFGGLGFVRLDEAFRAQGHETAWVSFGDQVARLQSRGCRAESLPGLAQLALMPITCPEEITTFQAHHDRRIRSMAHFRALLEAQRPDLLIIDRILVCAGLAADQLAIPYVAIGTPGGHWRFDVNRDMGRVCAHPHSGPVDAYRRYGEVLKQELGWRAGELGSGWLRSPYCNLHFLGQSFYAHIAEPRSANIFLHAPDKAPSTGNRIGISFGNQGSTDRLKQLVETVIADGSAGAGLSIMTGSNTALHSHFTEISRGRDVKLHQWVEFSDLMPELSCLVFLGGVGSIWHCVEHGIAMVAVPGDVGDQLENARRVAATGIGLHVAQDQQADTFAAVLRDTLATRPFDAALSHFRSPGNYSDTMESFVAKAARLAF